MNVDEPVGGWGGKERRGPHTDSGESLMQERC